MRMSVIGTGYLGATHATAMASLGHEVIGVDIDQLKVELLNDGVLPFYEPHVPEVLGEQLRDRRLRFTTSIDEATAFADIHFVCVGTPQRSKDDYASDVSFVDTAFEQLATSLRPGAVVVGKSTVPAGTAARLAPAIAAAGGELVWNPEFLREGFALQDTLHPDRIVLGIEGENGLDTMRAVYGPMLANGVPLIVTDYPTAELVKVAANSFLATKISFINAMAEVCEAAGADIVKLSEAIGKDERIGHRFLHAGLGFGGGCLPKDIRGFMARADELGVDQALTFLKNVDEINQRRRVRMVELAREVCGGSVAGQRVAVLGAAFKPDSDDIRDSPALDVALGIQQSGATVQVYDPKAMPNARIDYPTLAYADSALEACDGADAVLHLTEWREFRDLGPDEIGKVVRHKRMLDGRNALDPAQWRAAGWTFRALGRQ